MTTAQTTALQPVISLGYVQVADGTYTATMTVSGLATEAMAQAAIDHMHHLFGGEEIEAKQ